MGEETLARRERRELCDLMDQLGPDAATLCEGWTTRHLAAHLVLRDGRLDAVPGIVLPMLAGHTARVQQSIMRRPWPQLVAQIRSGPPWWSPLRLPGVGDRANTMEFFVHHEDVRRAQPEWRPRMADEGRAQVLWALLGKAAGLLYRRSPVGVVLRTPQGWQRTARRADHSVVLVGSPEELVLHAFGRDRVVVAVEGDEVDVAGLQSSQRGL
ncbi:MAG TPA: TIGR03085 family metal-binding protein [Pseudonocardiaceae bacterium]|nr:TIGR03085 family metal-binding protein [Pseudonocardiaceae bacterium]